MWDYGTAHGVGGALGATRFARRWGRLLLKLFALGVVIAGLIYTYVVFHAVSERSPHPHVHAHSTR